MEVNKIQANLKKNNDYKKCSIILVIIFSQFLQVLSHGRLMEPPNRSSLWRLKEFEIYEPEKNYDDNQLWCGGIGSQYNLSGGKCGPCGDEYLKSRPRENENGGTYGRGIITRVYKPGQVIPIGVELTVNHLGYFVFSICELSESNGLEEEECFEKSPLQLADGSGVNFYINSNDTGYYKTMVKLPAQITLCKHCVIRWHYRTGNRWGIENGVEGLGKGEQETFRGCSDVAISTTPIKPNPTPKPKPNNATTTQKPPINTVKPALIWTNNKPTSKPKPLPVKPHPAPTQRPPLVILPSAPKVTSTPKYEEIANSKPDSNKHPHPLMKPPKLESFNNIKVKPLLDILNTL